MHPGQLQRVKLFVVAHLLLQLHVCDSGALLRPSVLFVCRDAGETLAFLPVIEILNNSSGLVSAPSSAPRAVALATTLNAAQRLSKLPAAVVLTWERLGLPNANDQRFLARNATLPEPSLGLLLSQLQVRLPEQCRECLFLSLTSTVHALQFHSSVNLAGGLCCGARTHGTFAHTQPEVVVTGLVSSIQLQLSKSWSRTSRMLGYDDGFGLETWLAGGKPGAPSGGIITIHDT
jgi:hypothetical protein